MKRILLSLTALLITLFIFAQDSAVAQADREAKGLRADGKIYVVVAVLVTILCGLFFYIARLDRRITKMEKGSYPR